MNIPELSEKERARRQKKNRARKLDRLKSAAGRALPPVVGLSKEQYAATFGTNEGYDTYADAFILAAKKARRRYEFPLEPLGGVSFPSPKPHRKGMKLSRE